MTQKSMTGYGKEEFVHQGLSYLVEIHSVNRKTLEISMFLPKEILSLDLDIRKKLSSVIKRGHVTFKLTKENESGSQGFSAFEPHSLKLFQTSLKTLSADLGYDPSAITFEFLVDQYEKNTKFLKKFDEEFTKLLLIAIDNALNKFLDVRIQEGELLIKALLEHLNFIRKAIEEIKQSSASIVDDYRKKIETKIDEMILSSADIQERIAKEVIFYVDKIDISEEIQRLSSHLEAFEKTLFSKEEAVGKKLEFIVLEMQRESHTLTAKSQQLSLINQGLLIKSEIEKIKEQLQNLE